MTSRSARSLPALAEDLVVVGAERRLIGRGEEVLHLDLLGAVVEDRRLDRSLEEFVRVAAEELVERVLSRDIDGQAARGAGRRGPTSGAGWRRFRGS